MIQEPVIQAVPERTFFTSSLEPGIHGFQIGGFHSTHDPQTRLLVKRPRRVMKLSILIPLTATAIAFDWQSEVQNFAYTSLHIFSTASVSSPHTNADGSSPHSGLALFSNTFYGSTDVGGSDYGTNGSGVVFALTFPVSLGVVRSNASCAVSWPSPSTGFILQQNSDLTTTNWTNSSALINDNGTTRSVTNSAQTGSLFFRLKHSYP
jgi:hypothetical protein